MPHQITELCTGCTACVKICPVSAIRGEKKSVHKINETFCIDCGACGRICPHKAILNQSAEHCVPIKVSLWPKPVFNEKMCASCRICSDGCPVQCISMRTDVRDKHPRPFLPDAKRCISCGFCVEDCPVGAVAFSSLQVV